MRFLESKDPEEIALMQAITDEYLEVKELMNKNLGTHIANAVWGAIKR